MKIASLKLELGSTLMAGCLAVGLAALSTGCSSTSKGPAPLAPRAFVPGPGLEPAAVAPLAPQTPDVVLPAAPKEETEDLVTLPPDKGSKPVAPKHGEAKHPDVKKVALAGKPASYTVVKGDSFSRIAAKHGVSVKALAAANGMKETDVLPLGKKIEIPAAGAKPAAAHKAPAKVASAKPTPKKAATTKKTGEAAHKTTEPGAAAAAPADASAPAAGGKYVVKQNDNPWTIAKKLHVKRADLLAANNLTEKSMLHIGQELTIPASSGTAAAVPVAGTPDTVPAAVPGVAKPPTAGGETAAPPVAAAPSSTFEYVVSEGETLDSIASSYGITRDDIKRVNPAIKSDADLKPNGAILIPTK
jgi:LysM repeat protein